MLQDVPEVFQGVSRLSSVSRNVMELGSISGGFRFHGVLRRFGKFQGSSEELQCDPEAFQKVPGRFQGVSKCSRGVLKKFDGVLGPFRAFQEICRGFRDVSRHSRAICDI